MSDISNIVIREGRKEDCVQIRSNMNIIDVIIIQTRSTRTTEAQLSKIKKPLKTQECAIKPLEMASL